MNDEKRLVLSAAQDAINLYHEGDMRDDHTYATHVLRVACRLLSPHHFNLTDDYRLILAISLHDVIEDRPERLVDGI